jgi:hypothetical protein
MKFSEKKRVAHHIQNQLTGVDFKDQIQQAESSVQMESAFEFGVDRQLVKSMKKIR